MKVTLATEKLKSVVSKAMKGVGNNSLIPLTSMLGIKKLENENFLKFYSTNGRDTLVCKLDCQTECEPFTITVSADLFGRLISKITSEQISFAVDNGNLFVGGNGMYKIPIIYDEEGAVDFPEYPNFVAENDIEFMKNDVLNIIHSNKNSLAKTMEMPYLTGYYLGEKAIATDTNVICFNDTNLFKGKNVLLSSDTMELLSISSEEKLKMKKRGNQILFTASDIILYTSELDGKDIYPVEDINSYLTLSFPYKCELPKDLLNSVLDRLSLFIEPYDRNAIDFTFTKDKLTISSKKSSSVEDIRYLGNCDCETFTCAVDVAMIKDQISSISADKVDLYFGEENAIKITSDKVVNIISLLEEE